MKLTALVLLLCGAVSACITPKEPCNYAIVVDSIAMRKGDVAIKVADQAVVETLRKRHADLNPRVIARDCAKEKLSQIMPKYTVFVTKGGKEDVEQISKLCRELDNDPYFDTFWGIIPNADSEAALTLVQNNEPIQIKRAIDCENILRSSDFETCYTFDENQRGKLIIHDQKGDRAEPTNHDNTEEFVRLFQTFKPQLLVTSAHASEVNWLMGYCGPNMEVYSKNGTLIARDTKKKLYDLTDQSPKIHLAVGNCSMGNGVNPDQMVPALIKSGGVKQFVGYTVPTWYGRMGWGMLGMFTPCQNNKGKDLTIYAPYAGFYNVTEAFHFNNDALIREELSGKLNAQEKRGHAYDRDVCALYGDPALDARVVAPKEKPFTYSLTRNGDTFTLDIRTLSDGTWPICGVYIPIDSVYLRSATNNDAIEVTERYILFKPKSKTFKKGEIFTFELIHTLK